MLFQKDKIKIPGIILLASISLWDTVDSLLMIREYIFLYAVLVGFFIYLLPINIILIILSNSLKESDVNWQKVLAMTGLIIGISNIFINILMIFLGILPL